MPPETGPYRAWVESFADLLRAGEAIGAPGLQASQPKPIMTGAPKALLFAPHPVIIGGLPLRLMRECGFAVTNVAVTLGSNRQRRSGRRRELEAACGYLGFGLVVPGEDGLDGAARAESGRVGSLGRRNRRRAGRRASAFGVPAPCGGLEPHACRRAYAGARGDGPGRRARVPGGEDGVLGRDDGAEPHGGVLAGGCCGPGRGVVAAHRRGRSQPLPSSPASLDDGQRSARGRTGRRAGRRGAPDRIRHAVRLRRWEEGQLHDVLDRGRILSAADPLDQLFRGKV